MHEVNGIKRIERNAFKNNNIDLNLGELNRFSSLESIDLRDVKVKDIIVEDLNNIYKIINSSDLIVHLDGINNIRNGHSYTTQIWEDISGNNNDAVWAMGNFNTFTWTNNAAGFQLNGSMSASRFNISSAPLLNKRKFTFEFVIKVTNYYNWGAHIVGNMNSKGTDPCFTILITKYNKYALDINDKYKILTESQSTDLHTHTITLKDYLISYYVDGNYIGEYIVNDQWYNILYNKPINIGSSWADGGLCGYIYSVKIYNDVLTDEEIIFNHNYNNKRFSNQINIT